MKHTLKLVLATSLVIFNLFVCFVGTYAWYVSRKQNDVSAMQVQMYTHELDLDYKIYKYSEEEKTIVDATNYQDALTMQKYDSIINSRNVNTSIVIEFFISGEALSSYSPVALSTVCTNSTLTDRVLSNIVEIKILPLVVSVTEPADIYDYVLSNCSITTALKFKNNSVKSLEITKEITNYSSYIVDSSLKLFMVIDYSESLLGDFDFSSLSVENTTFTNDLTEINFTIYDED